MSFLAYYEREHLTTRKVLHAFPAEQSELRAHERSNTARQLAWTFALEEELMLKALRQQPVMTGAGFPAAPESWVAILDQFDAQHGEIMKELDGKADADIGGTVQWFTGPGKVGDFSTLDFLLFLLHDQIHHRGQLSVYVRLAGGKVPAIYGPSADEPWF